MPVPVVTPRQPRSPQTDPGDPDVAAEKAQERALAARTATFNLVAKQQAEDEREREVLEQMMLAQVKFEDEIMKKWIEMI